MVTAISPFRYFTLARYVLSRMLDAPPISRKGKERLLSWAPRMDFAVAGAGAGASAGVMRTSVEERRSESAQSYSPDVAGPSTPPKSPLPPLEPLRPDPRWPPESDEIYRLMNDERLLQLNSIKPPREVVVLCHGLYGFSTATPIPLFPSLKLHYWASVLEVLRDRMGVNVLVVGVKGTGSIKERAEQMHEFLKTNLPKGTGVNFVAHSMGGLDCRHLISTIKPTSYTPLSLTTIGTPHRGSPFMDWCAANIGVGSVAAAAAAAVGASKVMKALPYSLKSPLLSAVPEAPKKEEGGFASFTSALNKYLLGIFDSPAYSNLTTSFLRDHFNPNTPDDPNVKYTSVAGRTYKMSVLHPLWFPKLVLDASAENGYAEDDGAAGKGYEGNDGLVSVSSAKWGEFIGAVDETHHWDLRGEGGLFPTSLGKDPKEKEPSANGNGKPEEGWDWKGKLESGIGEHLGLENKAKLEKAIEDAQKVAQTAVNKAQPSSSWDIAQVGQVIDWVADLIPGTTAETQKKQLADAQREKDKDERRKAGVEEPKKKNKAKFDLERFYGGLMLKLRDDGF